MPEDRVGKYPDPREEDIYAGDRRISRPDSSLPDWEVPDTSYRPIPIVWFTGAMIIQMLAMWIVSLFFSSQNGWLTIAVAGLMTGIIGKWTWDRGMKDAASGWKIATISVLLLLLALVCLGASTRL
ncbi:hypothetical protein FGU71_12755 [Erythrobacter insulae]|uniref:Uncharacterized protein n=1 Tax=Erythrobacter insulae TaxID=2584124 RepID=A0A547P6W8_9SPHN|nr:hypothetical protein [Erythrobacter insulae]TRD09877.1 hypothetical protein FGU71_12755 [Erythrobacter insulae]